MEYVGTLEVTTPSTCEVRMLRRFNAPRDLVFKALTTPDLLKRWQLGPPGWSLEVCEVDLRVGGRFRYVWRGPDGTEMGAGGTYRGIIPPERIVHTELFDDDWTGGETLVTTVLAEEGTQTMLTMTVLYSSQEARDAAVRTGMEQGVAASFDRLAELLMASTR